MNNKFVNVKLRRVLAENIIETYIDIVGIGLVTDVKTKKKCKNIIKTLKKSLL